VADLSKELQGCAEALPAELKRLEALVAAAVVELCALVKKSKAEITALRSIHLRLVAAEAKHVQDAKEAEASLEMIRVMVDEVAGQLSRCAKAAALLDEGARTTLHAGLALAALGTHTAAEAKTELALLLAAAEQLQDAVKPKQTGSLLGSVGGFFGRLVGFKRARE
jgi:hypothetical protein